MGVCEALETPVLLLLLLLFFLGPGEPTTADPLPQGVECIVFNEDYMTCVWARGQKPTANYSLYYWLNPSPISECKYYLQSDGVNTGCWFNVSKPLPEYNFNIYVNASQNDGAPFIRHLKLPDLVKPDPPIALSVRNTSNNQLELSWRSPFKKSKCLQHCVQYKSNKDSTWMENPVKEMKFNLPSVDPNKFYTFYVKSKVDINCGSTKLWSELAGPVYWGTNVTSEDKEMHFWIQNVLILIGSIFILLFVLTMMRMERVWLVLMPRIPNPSRKFEDLFTAYQGNFSAWAGVSKDAAESFKPSYHESICHISELLPGGGYLPMSKAGASSDDSRSKVGME